MYFGISLMFIFNIFLIYDNIKLNKDLNKLKIKYLNLLISSTINNIVDNFETLTKKERN